MIKPEIAKIIREVDENYCIGNHELVAKVAEKYAEQRAETASAVDTIVNRTFAGELNKYPDPYKDKEIRTALNNVRAKLLDELKCG